MVVFKKDFEVAHWISDLQRVSLLRRGEFEHLYGTEISDVPREVLEAAQLLNVQLGV